jgi:hypothetical protein
MGACKTICRIELCWKYRTGVIVSFICPAKSKSRTTNAPQMSFDRPEVQKNIQNTYNSGYSLVVTHLTTNPPVRCLNRAERTGSLVFNVLWSYVEGIVILLNHISYFIAAALPTSKTTSKSYFPTEYVSTRSHESHGTKPRKTFGL